MCGVSVAFRGAISIFGREKIVQHSERHSRIEVLWDFASFSEQLPRAEKQNTDYHSCGNVSNKQHAPNENKKIISAKALVGVITVSCVHQIMTNPEFQSRC